MTSPRASAGGNPHQAKSSSRSGEQALRGVGLFLVSIHRTPFQTATDDVKEVLLCQRPLHRQENARSVGHRKNGLECGWRIEKRAHHRSLPFSAKRNAMKVSEKSVITTISFDADGTLWDFSSVMQEALSRTLLELRTFLPGSGAEALTVADLQQTRDEVARTLRGNKVSLEYVRLKAFEQTLKNLGCDDPELASHHTMFYLEHRFTAIALYPDVLPTLSLLKGTYRLGLVTNGNTYPERCGLPGLFAFTIFAQDYQVQKPQPEFYEQVLSETHTNPYEIIHVGDSLCDDVGGAQAVGIWAIWLNRHQVRNETSIQPFAEITSLEELPDILAQCAFCEREEV